MKFLFTILLLFSSLFATQLDKYPNDIKKIVAIGPGALRIVTILNATDKLVGIEKVEHKAIGFSEYRSVIGKEKINSLPIIGAGGPNKLPNLEMLIQLKPDLIVSSFIDKKQLQIINQKTKIPTISLDYGLGYGGNDNKIEAIKKSILLLGKVLHKEKRAKNIVDFMNNEEKELKKYNIKDANIYIGGIGFKGAHGITSTEKFYPSFELLGVKNPLAKNAKSNHVIIQEEALVLKNPDYIFLDLFGKKIIKENFKKKKSLYTSLKAYKNKQIYWLLPYNFYNTNISNVYINSWIILSKLGYNIDIKSKMQTIYNTFYKNGASKLMKTRYPLKSFY
jgi:iron complex transport system substrate-binding protein